MRMRHFRTFLEGDIDDVVKTEVSFNRQQLSTNVLGIDMI